MHVCTQKGKGGFELKGNILTGEELHDDWRYVSHPAVDDTGEAFSLSLTFIIPLLPELERHSSPSVFKSPFQVISFHLNGFLYFKADASFNKCPV